MTGKPQRTHHQNKNLNVKSRAATDDLHHFDADREFRAETTKILDSSNNELWDCFLLQLTGCNLIV